VQHPPLEDLPEAIITPEMVEPQPPAAAAQPISAEMLAPEPVFQGLATNADVEPAEQVPFLSLEALSQLGVTQPPPAQDFPPQIIVAPEPEAPAQTDYAIPLLAALPTEPAAAEPEPEPIALVPIAAARKSRGHGMVFGGLCLLALALTLIAILARQWSDAVWAMVPRQPSYDWLATQARFGTFVFGGASLTLAWLAVGAIRRNRWAVPLVHSLAWFIVIAVLLFMAAYVGVYLFISPELADKAAMTARLGLIQRTLAVGMVLPLCFIFLFQRDHLKAVCRRFDRAARWTDNTPEPLLMLWWPCVLGALFCGGVAFAGGVFPWFGSLLQGNAGLAASAGSAAALALAALLLAKKSRLGWLLAFGAFTAICASGVQTFLKVPFQQFLAALGGPSQPAGQTDLMPAVVFGAVFVALLAMLVMARGVLWNANNPGNKA
jgi:hypothetical protein